MDWWKRSIDCRVDLHISLNAVHLYLFSDGESSKNIK